MKRECDTCTYSKLDFDEMPCSACNCCDRWEAMTNADHIRSLSDEELAVFLECFGGCHYCSEYETAMFDNDGILDCDGDCEQHILDWLKQPHKDGEGK